ncbi:HAMP domain-containing protein [Thiolapillus sp.]
MTLRNKLAFSFLAIGILFAVQVFITIQSNNHLAELVEEAVDKNQMAIADLNNLNTELQKLRRYEKEYFIYIGDAIKKRHYEYEWKTSFQAVNDMLERMLENRSELFSEADRKMFQQWQKAVDFYGAEFARIIDHYKDMRLFGEKAEQARAMHSVDANSMIADGKNRLSEVIKGISAMSAQRTEYSHHIIEEMEETFNIVKWVSVASSVLTVIIAIFLVIRVPGALISAIHQMTGHAERLAAGDYSQAINKVGISELDDLAGSLEKIRLKALQRR